MPELPEVEIMTRNVRRWAGGACITAIDVADPKVVVEGAESLEALTGARVVDVRRRAKLLLMETSAGVLSMHFRMTGKVVVRETEAHAAPRLTLGFDNGARVSFVDRRRLGEIHWWPGRSMADAVRGIDAGPEPYPETRPGWWWAERFAGARGAIKPAMLQPQRVAGIGNILASELCFAAGIDPRTPVPDVEPAAWERLAEAVVPLIEAVITREEGDEIAYLNDGGDVADTAFVVYAREGAPCVQCGGDIERFVQSGRSTFWCPVCQRVASSNAG